MPTYEYGVRSDWTFTEGHEVIAHLTDDIDSALDAARSMDHVNPDVRHTVIRREVGHWHEFDEGKRP